MKMYRLQTLSLELQASYETYINELKIAGETPTPFVLDFAYNNFNELIEEFDNCSYGIGLQDGHVPHSTFFLIEDNSEIVGVSNLRHCLTDWLLDYGGHIGYGVRPSRRKEGFGKLILELSLVEAKRIGITRALITCSTTNTGSNKVILANRGKLEKTDYNKNNHELTNYYWINLNESAMLVEG